MPLVAFVPPLAAEEKLPLFNGRDLAGWTTWLRDSKRDDPRKVFSVVDGTLRISGDGYGYLATIREFRAYHLRLDFRWGAQDGLARGDRAGKALDSGVFLHASGPDGNSHDGDGAYMAAIECNVFEGATGDLLLIRGSDANGAAIEPRVRVKATAERDGDGFPYWSGNGDEVTLQRWGRVNWNAKSRAWNDARGFRGERDVEKPAGAWNALECLCRDRAIEVKLNGITVNRVSEVEPRKGKILLQCEGAEIFYRNVTVETFPE
jgi:hypothetical protein